MSTLSGFVAAIEGLSRPSWQQRSADGVCTLSAVPAVFRRLQASPLLTWTIRTQALLVSTPPFGFGDPWPPEMTNLSP
jgi:hypothetical protein